MTMLSVKAAIKNTFPSNMDLSKGVMGSLLSDFYKPKRHPEAFPYRRSIRVLLKALEWPRAFYAIDDYPKNFNGGVAPLEIPLEPSAYWPHHCQGVANDGYYWFISNEWNLWKISYIVPLAFRGMGHFAFAGFPDYLDAIGYDHLGDVDYYNGYLYVPVEGWKEHPDAPTPLPRVGRIALFDAKTPLPAYIHSAELFNTKKPHLHPEIPISDEDKIESQIHAPWCAINPLNGLLFTSEDNADSLYVYERAVVTSTTRLATTKLELNYKGKFALKDSDGSPKSFKRIQGGVFSKNGHFYLVSDDRDEDGELSNSGIYGFDMISGRNVSYTWVEHDGDQELEGIDIWDQDELSASHAPGIGGQIHVMLGDRGAPTRRCLV
jgi:hypothetical protein